jgi:hypothetical protein
MSEKNETKPEKPLGNSAIARMAGNIASGLVVSDRYYDASIRLINFGRVKADAVMLARMIVAEIEKPE